MKINIGGREVDLAKAFPLTIGDLKGMERDGYMTGGETVLGITETAGIVFHLARKADAEVTMEQVDKIELSEFGRLGEFLAKALEGIGGETTDRPTSTPSTPSPKGSG